MELERICAELHALFWSSTVQVNQVADAFDADGKAFQYTSAINRTLMLPVPLSSDDLLSALNHLLAGAESPLQLPSAAKPYSSAGELINTAKPLPTIERVFFHSFPRQLFLNLLRYQWDDERKQRTRISRICRLTGEPLNFDGTMYGNSSATGVASWSPDVRALQEYEMNGVIVHYGPDAETGHFKTFTKEAGNQWLDQLSMSLT